MGLKKYIITGIFNKTVFVVPKKYYMVNKSRENFVKFVIFVKKQDKTPH